MTGKLQSMLARLPEIKAQAPAECPCCHGCAEPATHAGDCTFSSDCPAESVRLRLDWSAWHRERELAEALEEARVLLARVLARPSCDDDDCPHHATDACPAHLLEREIREALGKW